MICEQFLALIPMHQLRIEDGYKLNKSKLTSVQKSDSIFSCKRFQGFVLIYLLSWLCVCTVATSQVVLH